MTGKVTVIIATRDRRDGLTHTLCRLTELAPPPPVIVVDNGSADGTAQVVPPEVEHGLRLLEEPQRHSGARRYVG